MVLTSPKQDYSKRYNELVEKSWLAENSDVRWCMVIKPYWFAIWENIKNILDEMFKYTWHQNAYFPLLIPKSYFNKEAKHIEWFAKECAVVTHYRLKIEDQNLIVDPKAKLEEEYIIRPTSETIIWNTYKKRIHSYRDLPLLINQRANVMRREMRTRMFLRTSEFLRQEWHTAHATKQEAEQEAQKMLNVYDDFVSNFLAIFSFKGKKPEHEKFPWAVDTFTFEPMMQDWKALQMGTSHFLWQTFAKAFDVKYKTENNQEEFVRATSRWVSTRMIWWLIMAHSDEKWLVLPPAIAPLHIVIVPIAKNKEEIEKIKNYLEPLTKLLDNEKLSFYSKYFKNSINISYKIDEDLNHWFWWKCTQYELQWVPIRLTVWSKELQNNEIEIYTRYNQEKKVVKLEELLTYIDKALYKIQNNMFQKHFEYTLNRTKVVENIQDFEKEISDSNWNYFVFAHWDWKEQTALKIQEKYKAVIRCIPFDNHLSNVSDVVLSHLDTHKLDDLLAKINTSWKSLITEIESWKMVLFAKSY